MKRWLLLLLILAVQLAFGQIHAGKTCDEILKMGHDKWFDYYTTLKGESTLSMSSASNIYAECLSKRNMIALAKLPENDRNWIGSQFKIVRQITVDLFSLEARGGGTMFQIIAASDHVRAEEMFQKLIRVGPTKGAPTKAQTKKIEQLVRDSRKQFVSLAKLLKTEADPQNPTGFKRQDFLKWAYEARAKFEKWLKSLPPSRAAANILMLEHIYDSLLPKNFEG